MNNGGCCGGFQYGFIDVLHEEEAQAKLEKQWRWDARWMEMAELVSTWSKDPGHKIGAVLVYPTSNVIVGSGYNGFPRALRDENLDDRGYKLSRTIHAEVNAIYNVMATTHHRQGLTLYVYGLPPCLECAKNIIQCGIISRVVVNKDPRDVKGTWSTSCLEAALMMSQTGIKVEVSARL
jgi:dCMP deaminase